MCEPQKKILAIDKGSLDKRYKEEAESSSRAHVKGEMQLFALKTNFISLFYSLLDRTLKDEKHGKSPEDNRSPFSQPNNMILGNVQL